MHYFAYGTLLVEESMRGVCPSAKNVGYMRLDGYEMAFGNCSREGLAGCTLVAKEGAVTYGIQYELTDEDMAKMDDAAEVSTKQWVHTPITLIDASGNKVPSSTYIIPGELNEWAPTEKYVSPILKGLETADFPIDYKTFMNAMIDRVVC
ncbi:gamma-glutamylcyclotransferase family protein [Maritalea porphyrae]|uniref:gamma-glutamylcyclotransferase family protein n=1 Tax=Maritalea porphyrae TaxID=880732 RepID=UPI0022AFDD36|nr:gamma-glutamylcyclotransferase family protein [Maritalea porphyrae]MCZ4271247.1 gamma-glutamylcyclotransferase [Maritalea porphyrae]